MSEMQGQIRTLYNLMDKAGYILISVNPLALLRTVVNQLRGAVLFSPSRYCCTQSKRSEAPALRGCFWVLFCVAFPSPQLDGWKRTASPRCLGMSTLYDVAPWLLLLSLLGRNSFEKSWFCLSGGKTHLPYFPPAENCLLILILNRKPHLFTGSQILLVSSID